MFKIKRKSNGQIERFKARLVVRGFLQKEGIDYEVTFSPAIKSDSNRVLFAIAAAFGWLVYQSDIKTAFLNGELLQRIFMRPPQGVYILHGLILELLSSLYGLK